MSRSVIPGLLLALAVLIALALRCPELDVRPMHNDEAVNALKFRPLLERGNYRYDPAEHHGPALAWFTLAWTKLTGVSDFNHLTEARLRLLTVLFGVGLILLLPLVADGLGWEAAVCAALLTAVSPAMVFYSRYYIHEMLLVFFTFLALAAGWRYYRNPGVGWAVVTGAAIGLMQCSKETFVLPLAAMAVAVAIVRRRARSREIQAARPRAVHLISAIVGWLAIVILLFTSFFTNASGPLDAVKTYFPWLNRAAGNSPHIHPWYFYLSRVTFFHSGGGPVWTEGLILVLALAGFIFAFRGPAESHSSPPERPLLLRFLAVYTGTLAFLYSVIPYKTPWCLLGFWHGTILLAGVGAVALVRCAPRVWMRSVLVLILLAAAAQLAAQSWRAAVIYSADRRNPYVYAQTSPDVCELVSRLESLAQSQPEGRHLVIKVMSPDSDYWPLPWYLREFDRVGWWDRVPADPSAPVMIVSAKLNANLDADHTHIMAGLFQLRPDSFLELYVETNLWNSCVNSRH